MSCMTRGVCSSNGTAARGCIKALGRPVIVSLFRSMGVVGDGTPDLVQLVTTGVSAADSVVSLFDGLTQLGSTTADASGIWRFTIDALSDEIHNFTAVATNAAGEMSAASPAVGVTAVMNRIGSIVPDAAAVGDSIANAGVLMLNGVARRLLTAKLCPAEKRKRRRRQAREASVGVSPLESNILRAMRGRFRTSPRREGLTGVVSFVRVSEFQRPPFGRTKHWIVSASTNRNASPFGACSWRIFSGGIKVQVSCSQAYHRSSA
jgi:Bacterial Ig-like domain